MAGNSEAKYSIGKLEGESNWLTWKFQMRHLLLDRELWGHVDGSTKLKVDANAVETAEFNRKNQKAMTTIVMAVSQSVVSLIQSCEGPVDLWKVLCSNFEKNSLMAKLMLLKRYHMMEMTEGSSVEKFVREMNEITDRLSAMGAPVSAEDQVLILLGSLPASYRPLVTTLGAQQTKLDMITVKNAILEEEMRGKGHDGTTGKHNDQALVGEVRGQTHQPRGRATGGYQGNRRVAICFSCNQTGHFIKDCPANTNQLPPQGNQFNTSRYNGRPPHNRSYRGQSRPPYPIRAKLATEESDEEYMLVMEDKLNDGRNDEWIIDSGASLSYEF